MTGPGQEMRRSVRQVSPLGAARGSAVALALTLCLAGCLGGKSAAEHAAEAAQLTASTEGLTVETVSCSPNGDVWWTCTGRLQSGRRFSCSVGPAGRVSQMGACTVLAGRP
ncbi:MAG TPA: hypothetical protein VGH56_07060 [Solirubrobacteraceae bacterium]